MPINILIPDGNSTWVLPVIRCLEFRSDFKIFVLSTKKRTPVKYSKGVFYYKYYLKTDDVSWLKIINSEIQINAIDIVIPIAEAQAQFLIKNSNLINRAKVVPLASEHNFETTIFKNKLAEFCEKHLIPYPKSRIFKKGQDFYNNVDSLNYPVLIKPLHDKGGNGIMLFDTQNKLEAFVTKNYNIDTFFIQEYIQGYDIDCSVLCLNGNILTYTIQKGFLSGHSPYAPYLGIEFLDNDEVLAVTQQLMSALNWSGVAHIDLRYDQLNKCYKVLEVNARFWGSIEASRVANINFPVLLCDLTLGKDIPKQTYSHIKYMRIKGVFKYIYKHPSYMFYLKSIYNHTETKAVLKDPIPTVYKFREWVERLFLNLFAFYGYFIESTQSVFITIECV